MGTQTPFRLNQAPARLRRSHRAFRPAERRVRQRPEVGTRSFPNRMDQVRENGATSGAGLLADYSYDTLGRPTSLARGNGAGTSWSYVANTRNWWMTQNLSGTAHDLTLGFTFSPAPQVTVRTISNTAHARLRSHQGLVRVAPLDRPPDFGQGGSPAVPET